MSQSLPIDAVLPQVIAQLRTHPNLVLTAPPGAGKTTRLPVAILQAGLAEDREILVLEPRRIAARMAASRVASELGEKVGQTVGYEVRFDRRTGSGTRIRFITEGLLARYFLGDPILSRFGVVLLDEFHERHIATDVSLARLRLLQKTKRPDLRIVVMSATLDPAPLSTYLDNSPSSVSEGRTHPITIEYVPRIDDRPLANRVSAGIRSMIRLPGDGDVLVFLPGAAEIRRAQEQCAEWAADADLDICILHGDLSPEQQDHTIRRGDRRKIILSTNVAETSVTIEGVSLVVDSGLARIARHSPWSGVPTVAVSPISQASAIQRAGRAGRTQPGHCLRLYTEHDFRARRAFEMPEIQRADLADVSLQLGAAGVTDLQSFQWFEPPASAALFAARTLLEKLGAIDASGAITARGRQLASLPLHPRQGRILLEAHIRGATREGCVLACLLGERELRLREHHSSRAGLEASNSDLIDDVDRFLQVSATSTRGSAVRAAGIDPAVFFAVDRGYKQLMPLARKIVAHVAHCPTDEVDDVLRLSILTGYPDRVAQRRRAHAPELLMCNGSGALLDRHSAVVDAPYMVAVDAQKRDARSGNKALVRRASSIDSSWLLDLFMDDISEEEELLWNSDQERVEHVRRLCFGRLVLDEERSTDSVDRNPSGTQTMLASATMAAGIDQFLQSTRWSDTCMRLSFLEDNISESGLSRPSLEAIEQALCTLCIGSSSFAQLRNALTIESLLATLGVDARLVNSLAPETVNLPGRRRVPVHYESDRMPWIESRLQDFFGLSEGPGVANGRVPLTLHLQAPNRRTVQVTSDLAGFWKNHYPAVRRELMRRYPKHPWPEKP